MRLLTTNGWQQTRGIDWYDAHFTYNGQTHPLGNTPSLPTQTLPGSSAEQVGNSLASRVQQIHERSGPVAAAATARALVVSDIRFAFRPSFGSQRLFGNQSLAQFERPGRMTRSAWLYRAELDVTYTGNSYTVRAPDGRLFRLRPDWVAIILGERDQGADKEVLGYAYYPGGNRETAPVIYSADEVAHWAPEPLPDRDYLGGSWVTTVIREVMTDGQATDHLGKFFSNAATSNMVVKAPDGVTLQQFEDWVEAFEDSHAGSGNAWRTMYLAAGTDVEVVGSALKDLDYKNLQGGLDNRVCMRSRVPAIILGTREGLAGSSLNAGNYGATRRMWADTWFHPYAEGLCASLEVLATVPPNSELTYDPSRCLLLQEDRKDAADILQTGANTLDALYRAGFDADAAVEALTAEDLSLLVGRHTGLPSVQANTEEVTPDVA